MRTSTSTGEHKCTYGVQSVSPEEGNKTEDDEKQSAG